MYYSLGAVNRYNESKGRTVEGFSKTQNEGWLLFSLPTTWSLKWLGNNYWGLRLPVAILSILMILLLLDCIRRTSSSPYLAAILGLFCVTDFYITLFGRFHTPQIYSLFMISLGLWVIVRYKLTTRTVIALGVIGAVSVFVVYVYNAFFLGALGLLVIIHALRQKRIRYLVNFLFGFAIGFAFFLLLLFMVDQTFMDYVNFFVEFNAQRGEVGLGEGGIVSKLTSILKNVLSLVLTNVFRYNFGLLLFSLLGFVLVTLKLARRERLGSLQIFLLLFIGMLVAQTALVNSYPFKKLIVVYPAAILLSTVFLNQLKESLAHFKYIMTGMLLVCLLLALYNLKINTSETYWAAMEYGYYSNNPSWLNYINVGVLVLMIILVLRSLKSGYGKWRPLLWLIILPGVLYSAKNLIADRKFELRDELRALRG